MTKGDKLEMIEDNGHDAMGKVQRCIKRGFDLVAAFTGIVVCSPVFLIISLLITYQGNGPVSSTKSWNRPTATVSST